MPEDTPFPLALHDSPFGFMVIQQGQVVSCNPALQSILGLAAHEMLEPSLLSTGVLNLQKPLPCQQQEDYWSYNSGPPVAVRITVRCREIHHEIWVEDIRNERAIEGELQETLFIHSVVADISTRLIQATPEQVDHLIEQGLAGLGMITHVDRAYIFMLQDGTISNTHEWCAPGIEPQKHQRQKLDPTPFKWWLDQMQDGKTLSLSNINPQEQIPAEVRVQVKVQSVMMFPMVLQHKLVGYLGFSAVQKPRNWTVQTENALKLYGQAVANTLHRLEQENLLQEQNQTLSTLFRELPSGLMYEDENHHIKLVNQSMCDVMGCEVPSSALVGQDALQRFEEKLAPLTQSPEQFMQHTLELYHSTESQGSEEIALQDGRTLERLIAPVKLDGQVAGYLTQIRDITEKVQQNERMQRYHHWLDATVSSTPDILVNLAGEAEKMHIRIISANVRSLLGYDPHTFIEESVDHLMGILHPDNRPTVHHLILQGLQKQTSNSALQVQLRSIRGAYLPFDLRVRPVVSQGTVLGVVLVLRDIREQLAQQELLLQATEQAERASLAKSRFLSRMSHELRTPMNAILASAQILKMKGVEAHQARGIERILKAGSHLLTLIDDILDLSRIEAGKLNLNFQSFKVQNLIQDAIDLMQEQSQDKKLVWKIHLDPLPAVQADPDRLRQILLNLLSNAIKYNREGGTIEVYARLWHNIVRIGVKDSGIGIAPEDQPKVFTPFERFGNLREEVQGTGIGLALSKTLAESMHGKLGFQSTLNEGTHFMLELPLSALTREAYFLGEGEFFAPLEGLLLEMNISLHQVQSSAEVPAGARCVLFQTGFPREHGHWIEVNPDPVDATAAFQISMKWQEQNIRDAIEAHWLRPLEGPDS